MGQSCQDAIDFRALPGGGLVIALADGAGSAKRSEQGARWAVARALACLACRQETGEPAERNDWPGRMRQAFRQASQTLCWLADQDGESLQSFNTTLTCAVVLADCLVVGQIGDGAVVIRDADGALLLATQIQRGEFANETNFITQPDALEKMDLQVWDRTVDAIAVTSDGLIHLAMEFPSGEPYRPFFDPLFAFAGSTGDAELAAAQLADFLSSDRVCARTDDDKSLVIAQRIGNRAETALLGLSHERI